MTTSTDVSSSSATAAATTTRKRKQAVNNKKISNTPQDRRKAKPSKNKTTKKKRPPAGAADPDDDDDAIALEQAYTESKNQQRNRQNQFCQITMLSLGAIIVILAISINRYTTQQYVVTTTPTTSTTGDDDNDNNVNVNNVEKKKPENKDDVKKKSSSDDQHHRRHRYIHNNNDYDNDGRPIATMSNDWKVLETHPHDPTAFTQGLEVVSSSSLSSSTMLLVESTGHYGYDGGRGTFDESSVVRIWDVHNNGKIIQQVQLDSKFFGEGLTKVTLLNSDNNDDGNDQHYDDYYLLLTWREQTALLLNTTTLQVEYSFKYETHSRQGWGVAYDPIQKQIYVSDGSHIIHVWELYYFEDKQQKQETKTDDNDNNDNNDGDTTTTTTTTVGYREVRRFPVSLKLQLQGRKDVIDRPELHLLNELEWDPYTNTILSNLWFENLVFRICPHTGHVLKVYDFNRLYPKDERSETADVLNGIAIVPPPSNNNNSPPHHHTQEWWLTGKYWPYIYKVQVEV